MKKLLLLVPMLLLCFGYTFAITQSVNETNGVNYGYIKDVYKKGATYYLSIDYVQLYTGYQAALARAEDGIIFGDLSTNFNQNYYYTSYTVEENGQKFATVTTSKKITSYLLKKGKKVFYSIINKINNYMDDLLHNPQNYTGTDASPIFNGLSEIERMIIGPSFDPSTGWGSDYIRNTNTKIRNIPFSSSAKLTVEGEALSLDGLVTWSKNPTQDFVKVFLRKGKIEGFRVEYHP